MKIVGEAVPHHQNRHWITRLRVELNVTARERSHTVNASTLHVMANIETVLCDKCGGKRKIVDQKVFEPPSTCRDGATEFEALYGGNGLKLPLQYTCFDDVDGETGIPPLCRLFRDYDGSPLLSRWDGFGKEREDVSDFEERYVYEYLKDPRFMSKSLLKSRELDHVVYGIFAFLLQWSRTRLVRFGREYEGVAELVRRLVEDYDARRLLEYRGYPVSPRIFRIISWHFDRDLTLCGPDNRTLAPVFSIHEYVSEDWLLHFDWAYGKLRDESWDSAELSLLTGVRRVLGVPFERFVNHARTPAKRLLRPKYVTGVACCGKTTLLSKLQRLGWAIKSRGNLGTFAGKSKAPAHVAALHAATDHACRAGSGFVIGDRGPIDNPLWTAIMQLCDPKYEDAMVSKLLQFFDHTFNELVVRYHGGFDVVVFLDPFPSRNRKRMLMRCEKGDAQRGRMRQYVPAQFMAYYMFACLFGFEIVLVPYTPNGAFDVQAHHRNGQLLEEYYGRACESNTKLVDPVVSQLKNDVPDFMYDTSFAISHGIYK